MKDFQKNKSDDQQPEMFEEFQDSSEEFEEEEYEEETMSIFNIDFLKNIKIELSFDLIVIIAIACILFAITSYFLGIQKGKKILTNKLNYLKQTHMPEIIPQENLPKILTGNQTKPTILNKQLDTNKKNQYKPVTQETKPKQNKIEITSNEERDYKYTIQVGASRDKSAAIKDVEDLQKEGFEAFINITTSPNGKKWYKICVGKFKKSKEALNTIRKLKSNSKYNECFLNCL